MLRDVNRIAWALRNVISTTARLMVQYIELGPFDAAIFLVPPAASANPATGSVLKVEQFQLWDAVHSEIGLDHLHKDRGIDAQALLNGGGLRWKGKVLFSNAVRNKKQISSIGLGSLYTAAQKNGLRLDWSKGFKVVLEAQYWRHAFIRPIPKRNRFHDPISCDLFVDLDPVTVTVGHSSRPTEKLIHRRFSIETMSPIFMTHSAKTFSQSGIILTLEHIKRLRKRTTTVRKMTVNWYCRQYKELFSTTPGSDEAGVPQTHQVRTNSRDFYSALASHVDSAAFYQDLVVHKQLLSKAAFARFKKDCDQARTFPPEVRKWWGQWGQAKLPQDGEMIVIEDTPSPPQDQQEMDLDQLIIIDDDSLEIEYQEDEPMIWQPAAEETTTVPEATNIAIHTPHTALSAAAVSSVGVSKSISLDTEARRLISTIPKCMFDPPTLPADCQWVCPVTGCFKLFDLKGKLPRKVLVQLTPQEIDLLTSRAFTSKSQKALSIFFVIVDVHYDEHLSKLGIVADKDKMFRQIQTT